MTTRTCDQCGKHLITHRADARFCNERCRARWNNRHRKTGAATDIRIAPGEQGVGSRGGNVRSVSEARELQEQQKEKARWTLIVREHMARTLLETGYLHADDLYELGVPPAHDAIKGSQTAAFVCRGWMAKAGERKCSHKAANGRKAKIYKLTNKGRAELQTLVGNSGGTSGASSGGTAAVSGESAVGGPVTQVPEGSPSPSRPTDSASSDQSLAGAGGDAVGGLTGPQAVPETPHSGETSATGVRKPQGPEGSLMASPATGADRGSEGDVGAPSSPSEPARLPGFDESAAARHMKDAA